MFHFTVKWKSVDVFLQFGQQFFAVLYFIQNQAHYTYCKLMFLKLKSNLIDFGKTFVFLKRMSHFCNLSPSGKVFIVLFSNTFQLFLDSCTLFVGN